MDSDRDPNSATPLMSDRGAVAPRQRLLDVSQAAEFLAVTVSTLYGWVWQRKISFVKLGRALRFDVADLERFVDQNRVRSRRNGQP
jgi:excisionase family DNA binding protein